MNFKLFICISNRARKCKLSALVYENYHFVSAMEIIIIDNCSFFENTLVIDSVYIYILILKMPSYVTVKTNKQTNKLASLYGSCQLTCISGAFSV